MAFEARFLKGLVSFLEKEKITRIQIAIKRINAALTSVAETAESDKRIRP
jgi:predicted RNA-binding protein with EMAP domain